MKAQNFQELPPTCRQGKFYFSFKGRKSQFGTSQGKLRICSMPGAFLVLGLIVVFVGSSMAVAGYWRYGKSSPSRTKSISEPQRSGWRLGSKDLLPSASLIHTEWMKLLGPVMVGVGLFILICAITVLYENRDRETKMLAAQVRREICTVSTSIPSADIKDTTDASSMVKPYPWIQTSPPPPLNMFYLHKLATSEPLLQTQSRKDRQDDQQDLHQPSPIHHHEVERPHTLHRSCNSSQTEISINCGPERGQ